MEHDDTPIGYLFTRREAIAILGSAGFAILTGCSRTKDGSSVDSTFMTPGGSSPCVVRPEMTEGPYFVDEKLNRTDIRSDPSDGTVKQGTELQLAFNVSRIASGACTPLAGALVDIWHCDAAGVYSDVSDPGFNTVGKKFLRGYQTTDANGRVDFTTIYPGWYPGRAVHVHFKIRSVAGASSAHEFTSQLFFDDALTDQVHRQQPYAAKGPRTDRNSGDGIYNRGGSQLLLAVKQSGGSYAGSFDIALQGA